MGWAGGFIEFVRSVGCFGDWEGLGGEVIIE